MRKYINLPGKTRKTSQTSEHCQSCERDSTNYENRNRTRAGETRKGPDNKMVPVHCTSIPIICRKVDI